MDARASFTAILAHTAGAMRGEREELEVPLRSDRPPDILRRPVNVQGSPSFEVWALASTEGWSSGTATYTFNGYTRRDPLAQLRFDAGDLLPWSRCRPPA